MHTLATPLASGLATGLASWLASWLALATSAPLCVGAGAAPSQDTQTTPVAASAAVPPTTPLAVGAKPTTAELVAARVRIAKLLDLAERRETSDDDRVALRRQAYDLRAWIDRSADGTPATERLSVQKSGGPGALNVVARIQRALAAAGAQVQIDYDMDLRLVLVSGPRWEVDDARDQIEWALGELEQRLNQDEAEQRRRAEDLAVERAEIAERALRASTIDIDWTGGTLTELVAAVRRERDCNVVLATPTTGEVEIPPFRVRFVTPEILFKSLNLLSARRPRSLVVEVVEHSVAPRTPTTASGTATLEPLPVIVIREHTPELRQELHDLSGWKGADDAGIKSLVEAIDFAMQNAGSAELVSLRYHEPTKLLFVKAPADSIALIREIVTTVRTK